MTKNYSSPYDPNIISGALALAEFHIDISNLIKLIRKGLAPLSPPPNPVEFAFANLVGECFRPDHIEGKLISSALEPISFVGSSLEEFASVGEFQYSKKSGQWKIHLHDQLCDSLGQSPKNTLTFNIKYKRECNSGEYLKYGSIVINATRKHSGVFAWALCEDEYYLGANFKSLRKIKNELEFYTASSNYPTTPAVPSDHNDGRDIFSNLIYEYSPTGLFFNIPPQISSHTESIECLQFYQVLYHILNGVYPLTNEITSPDFHKQLRRTMSLISLVIEEMRFRRDDIEGLIAANTAKNWGEALLNPALLRETTDAWEDLLNERDLDKHQRYAVQIVLQKWKGASHEDAFKKLDPPHNASANHYVKRSQEKALKLAKTNSRLIMPPWSKKAYDDFKSKNKL